MRLAISLANAAEIRIEGFTVPRAFGYPFVHVSQGGIAFPEPLRPDTQ